MNPPIDHDSITGRTVKAVVLAAGAVAVLAIGGWTLVLTSALTDNPCNDAQTFPGVVVIAVSVVCFALGHVSGHLRADPRENRETAPDPVHLRLPRVIAVHARLLARIALAAFLFLALLVLIYETIGLTNQWGTRPITSYVRCGASRSPVPATVIAGVMSALVGHWLWYPTRGRR